jgi:hypothetical protein
MLRCLGHGTGGETGGRAAGAYSTSLNLPEDIRQEEELVRQWLRSRLTYANITATIAVFLAIGSGAYAITTLPADSVGTIQLKRHAVTARKLARGAVGATGIRAGAVGARQIDGREVQHRVGGSCGNLSAVAKVNQDGSVGCVPTLPAEYGVNENGRQVTLSGTFTALATKTLPAGSSYLVLANVELGFTGPAAREAGAQCTLADDPLARQSETSEVTLPNETDPLATGTLPLQIAVPASRTATTVSLFCSQIGGLGANTTVGTQGWGLNAIQTASNN